jgi:hypothetical protein
LLLISKKSNAYHRLLVICALRVILLLDSPNDIKASKLKPDAPEFVPFRIKAPADLAIQADSKDPESPSAKAQKKQEKEERKAASLAKKVGKKVGKQVDGPEGTFECL